MDAGVTWVFVCVLDVCVCAYVNVVRVLAQLGHINIPMRQVCPPCDCAKAAAGRGRRLCEGALGKDVPCIMSCAVRGEWDVRERGVRGVL